MFCEGAVGEFKLISLLDSCRTRYSDISGVMGRSPCCEKAHTNKGAWTKEEDDRLIAYIKAHGEGCWRSLPKAAGLLRCGKSCRLRWINYLRPDLKRGNFTEEEDELIIKLHSLLGNKWSLIAGRLPGRTDNEIKNYWNTHIKRKLTSRGIDPVTHRPLNEPSTTPATTTVVSSDATTISFASVIPKQEPITPIQAPRTTSSGPSGANYDRNLARETRERCPDLNLELRISPPCQTQQLEQLKTGKGSSTGAGGGNNMLCFTCSLGLHNRKECACNVSKVGPSDSSTSVGYFDFLGLRTGSNLGGYRSSLEMKCD